MRILDYVSCGRRGLLLGAAADDELPELPEQQQQQQQLQQPSTPPRRTDQVTPVLPTTAKYRKTRSMSKSASAYWRPALGSISEDSTVSVMLIKSKNCSGRGVAGAGRGNGNNIKATRKTQKITSGYGRGDYRHMGVPAMIPAFAPTAFLF